MKNLLTLCLPKAINLGSNLNYSFRHFFSSDSFKPIIPVKIYSNLLENKKLISKENKGKTGIYKFVLKTDSDKFYIGSSIDLWRRITTHFSFPLGISLPKAMK
jgi:hypothetical protein